MYDNPTVRSYRFPSIDFDATVGDVCTIDVPKRPGHSQGRSGRVIGVHLENVTVDFGPGDGNAPSIQIGDGSDVDKYYDSGPITEASQASNLNAVEVPNVEDSDDIEVGRSTITCTFNAATGTGDGTADVVVTIAWD